MKNILFVLIIIFTVSCKKGESDTRTAYVSSEIDSLDTKDKIEAFTRTAHIPSKIDSLNSEDEIEAYVHNLDTDLCEFHLADYSKIMTLGPNHAHIDSLNRIYAKQLGINKTFFKTDFNNDGFTDLLLIGGWELTFNANPKKKCYQFNSQVVMNGGKGKSSTYPIALNYNIAFVPQIIYTDELPFLVLHHPQNLDSIRIGQPSSDTLQVKLVYKSGHFVEFNKNPVKHHKIKKIEFNNLSEEYGPFFQMILNKNNESWFIAIRNNFEERQYNEGTFKTAIKNSDFNAISDLLNYIDFKNLRKDYGIYRTGPPSMILRITYDNGKVKEIYNYSGAGTYGLETIQRLMMELRFSQDWKPAKEPKGIRMPRPERNNWWKSIISY